MRREDLIAIALVAVGLVVGILYSRSWDARRKSVRHLESGGTDKPKMKNHLPHEHIDWRFIAGVVLVLGMAIGIHMITKWHVIASIAIALSLAAVPVVWSMWLWQSRRMRYSPEGARALTKIVAELRPDVLAGHHSVLDVEGNYYFGYPKVVVLFESEHAKEEAKISGLLSDLADKVTEAVKGDVAFGRNRETFDPKQAVLATTSRQYREAMYSSRKNT